MKFFDLVNKGDKNKIRKYFILAGIVFLVVIALISIFQINIELLEINEIGEQYKSVYWTNLVIKYLTMLGAFIVIFAFTYFTNKVISKNLLKFFKEENVEPIKLPNKSISFFSSSLTKFGSTILFFFILSLSSSIINSDVVIPTSDIIKTSNNSSSNSSSTLVKTEKTLLILLEKDSFVLVILSFNLSKNTIILPLL